MFHPKLIARLLHCLLIGALLFSSTTPALYAQDTIYLPLVTGGEAAPTAHLLYRTRVTVETIETDGLSFRKNPFLSGRSWDLIVVG